MRAYAGCDGEPVCPCPVPARLSPFLFVCSFKRRLQTRKTTKTNLARTNTAAIVAARGLFELARLGPSLASQVLLLSWQPLTACSLLRRIIPVGAISEHGKLKHRSAWVWCAAPTPAHEVCSAQRPVWPLFARFVSWHGCDLMPSGCTPYKLRADVKLRSCSKRDCSGVHLTHALLVPSTRHFADGEPWRLPGLSTCATVLPCARRDHSAACSCPRQGAPSALRLLLRLVRLASSVA